MLASINFTLTLSLWCPSCFKTTNRQKFKTTTAQSTVDLSCRDFHGPFAKWLPCQLLPKCWVIFPCIRNYDLSLLWLVNINFLLDKRLLNLNSLHSQTVRVCLFLIAYWLLLDKGHILREWRWNLLRNGTISL